MSGPYGRDYQEGAMYPPTSSTTHLAPEASGSMPHRSSFATSHVGKRRRSPWLWVGIAAAAVVVILAAVLGGVLGSRASNNNKNNNAVGAKVNAGGTAAADATGGASGSATGSAAAANSTPPPGAAKINVVDLPAWNWGQNKSIGMCLGSWLQLEKWMLPDWFNNTVNAVQSGAGATTLDEWTFMEVLGQDRGRTALVEHWNTWVTEADIQQMFDYGINHLRIPTPFWAWIPTIAGEPYLNDTSVYQEQIERVLGYAYARGMYAIIDCHGLPGSQNGEQSSGHLTTEPSWFGGNASTETPNQLRSNQMVVAITEWLAANPYRSVVTGIEVINEPRPYTNDQITQLENYYERSYQTIQKSSWPVATFLHNGYTNLTYWQNFAAAHATNPPSMVMVDHPYPGNFPPQNNSANILEQICAAADRYLGYPIPICIDEWSIYTGVKDQTFEKQFYEQQLVTWAWSAGGMYWSWKLETSAQDLAAGLDYSQYSFATLLKNNSATVEQPSAIGQNGTTSQGAAEAYLSALAAQITPSCGAAPSNVAPYATASVSAWTAEQSARSSAAGQTLTATITTSTASSTATSTARAKRAVPMRA
ncbi:hypothetical protein JCM10908_003080 [Rhodotorula pacifica]|uniref:uncharacterized protein n=1 Tax=Rhodotorula pacifica TaxID=1495444 RepID=UPI003181F2DA